MSGYEGGYLFRTSSSSYSDRSHIMSLSGVMRAGAATARGIYLTGVQSSTAAGSALAVTGRRGMTTFQER